MHFTIAGTPARLLLLLALLGLTLPACTGRRSSGSNGGGDDDDSGGDDDDLFNPDDDDDLFNPDDDDVGPDDDDVGPDDDDVGPDDDDVGPDDDDVGPDDDDFFPDDDDATSDDDDFSGDDDDVVGSGECTPFAFLSCSNNTDSNSTTSSNATDDIDEYSCPATSLTGPEMAYWFSAESTGLHAIHLTGMTADLDLLVLEGVDCNTAATCADYARTTGNETATFNASAGDDFVIVVEGYAGASSSYNLAIVCPDTGDDDDATVDDDDTTVDDDDTTVDDDDTTVDDDDFVGDDDDAAGGCTDAESEPNGGTGDADGPITGPNEAWCGDISGPGDSDWFQIIVLTTLTSLTMRTDEDGSCSTAVGKVDTELHFYDSGGTLLQSDDDGAGNLCSIIVRNNISAGQYYVAVEHYSNNGSGTYRLDVDFSP